jgi:hypothetical protein
MLVTETVSSVITERPPHKGAIVALKKSRGFSTAGVYEYNTDNSRRL